MKQLSLSKWAGASMLAISLAMTSATLPAGAQTAPNNNPADSPAAQDLRNNNSPNLDTTPLQETRGKADNYGWLGLLGLLGLLNLLRKPSRPATTTAYREPDATTRTGDRF